MDSSTVTPSELILWGGTPTLLHGALQVVVVLGGFAVSTFHLHAVIWAEEVRILAVAHEDLIVLLEVLQSLAVLLHLQSLELGEWSTVSKSPTPK